MKKNLLIALLIVCGLGTAAAAQPKEKGDDLLVMFWNLENFFDWKDGGYSFSDEEFSAKGERRWTKSRFYAKRNAVAKSILWVGDKYGRMPDVIGFAEVENAFVLRSIVSSPALRKYDYGVVHYESEDTRGIDVALIYRKDVFDGVHSGQYRVCRTGNPEREAWDTLDFKTRQILHVALRKDGKEMDFLVNHHPSKYGGEKKSYPKRVAAMKRMKQICDSLLVAGQGNIVAMGDFNDTPDNPAFDVIDGTLTDKTVKLFSEGKGSLKYKGKWELIDLFFVSGQLDGISEMELCPIPFLMADDGSAPGKKPLRTYTGPRYAGGVSDHLPVILRIKDM